MTTIPSKKEQKKLRLKNEGPIRYLRIILAAVITVLVAGGAYLFWLSQPKVDPNLYAELAGNKVTKAQFEKFKKAYESYDAVEKLKQEKTAEERARETLVLSLGLQEAAGQNGIELTEAKLDQELAPRYKAAGGNKEQFYAYHLNKYKWDREVTRVIAVNDYYKKMLQDKIIRTVNISSVFIRWDYLGYPSTRPDKNEFETNAQNRLKDEFEPLFKQGVKKEEVAKKADIYPGVSLKKSDELLKDLSRAITVYRYDERVNRENKPFKYYPEGDKDWDQIDKLQKVGDTTSVFKSAVGYFVIYRLESKSSGEYKSWDDFTQTMIKKSKFSGRSVNKSKNNAAQINYDVLRGIAKLINNKLISKANAYGGVDCWSTHAITYTITFRDIITNQPINGVGVDIHRSSSDSCQALTGGGYYDWGGRQAFATTVNGTSSIGLNCQGSHWLWYISSPAGYDPINYFDQGNFSLGNDNNRADPNSWAPSNYASMPNGGSQGGDVWLTPSIPYGTVQGYKVDENLNPSAGPYSGLTVTVNGVGSSSANPYSIGNVSGARTVTVNADPLMGTGWALKGYTYCINSSSCHTGAIIPGSSVVINVTQQGQVHDIYWHFRQEFQPWLRTNVGNVTAYGAVVNQLEYGYGVGNRPPQPHGNPTDATHVVMNALNNTAFGQGRMCSDNFYSLGGTQSLGGGNYRNCPVTKYDFNLTDGYTSCSGNVDNVGAYVRLNSSSSTLDLVTGKTVGSTIIEYEDGTNCRFKKWWHDGLAGTRFFELDENRTDLKNTDFSGAGTSLWNYTANIVHKCTGVAAGCPGGINAGDYTIIASGNNNTTDPFEIDLSSTVFTGRKNVAFWAAPCPSPTGMPAMPGGWCNPASVRNVYIKSDIKVNATSTANRDLRETPQFSIVVPGDIYIDPDVTRLDAHLYATGKIYTCYRTGGGSPDTYYVNNGALCNKKIQIRGSVVGRKGLVLGRTYFVHPGESVDGAAEEITTPANYFIYPPLQWSKYNSESSESVNMKYLDNLTSPRF